MFLSVGDPPAEYWSRPAQVSVEMATKEQFLRQDTLTEAVHGRKSRRTEWKPKSLKRLEFQSQRNQDKGQKHGLKMGRKPQAVPLNLGTLCSQGYLSGCLRGEEAIRPAWTLILQCRIYSMVSKLNILFLLNREKESSCKFALILIIKMKFQNKCFK